MYLKQEVEYCLKKYPETRNNDRLLTLMVYTEFYWIKNQVITYKQYLNLPTNDIIKRYRAIIQNDNWKYKPTSEKILLYRQKNREKRLRTVKNYKKNDTIINKWLNTQSKKETCKFRKAINNFIWYFKNKWNQKDNK